MIFQLLIAFTVSIEISARECTTPNDEIAECISLYSCSTVIKAVAAQDAVSTEFVRLSNCGGNGSNPLVCCGSTSNFTLPRKTVSQETTRLSGSRNLLAAKRYCGYQHSDDYDRPDNNKAGINEFPWLALLLYKDAQGNSKPKVRCGGSLINDRYILTAAHCILDTRRHNYYISAVRLGDFNVESKVDCVEASGIHECSNPFEDFGIEETVTHPNYKTNPGRRNDITLVRLNGTVSYTDYIRPICLPFPDTVVLQVGHALQTSGWGRTNNSQLSETKKKIHSTLISNEKCLITYQNLSVQLDITESHFCTEDPSENMEFGCTGDSGGPLMFSYKYQWYLEGINSYGGVPCGSLPDIHTKVRNYMDWIQKTVKP